MQHADHRSWSFHHKTSAITVEVRHPKREQAFCRPGGHTARLWLGIVCLFRIQTTATGVLWLLYSLQACPVAAHRVAPAAVINICGLSPRRQHQRRRRQQLRGSDAEADPAGEPNRRPRLLPARRLCGLGQVRTDTRFTRRAPAIVTLIIICGLAHVTSHAMLIHIACEPALSHSRT